jgi:hypothetical protein
MISIVISYPSWSKCIDTFKKYLEKNTNSEYELIEIVDKNDVYAAFNEGVHKASNENVICICDDMFVSKGWDEMYIKYADGNTILTGYLIKPGFVPVSNKNIEFDCGTSPENFDYDKFSDYVSKQSTNIPDIAYGQVGWYMPIMFYKSKFIEYPNLIKFPYPNDVTLIDTILPNAGFKFAKIKSFVYHLQCFSNRG